MPQNAPIGSGIAVVLGEDTYLDLDQAFLAHPRNSDASGSLTEMDVSMTVMVMMIVVVMMMVVVMVIMPLDR